MIGFPVSAGNRVSPSPRPIASSAELAHGFRSPRRPPSRGALPERARAKPMPERGARGDGRGSDHDAAPAQPSVAMYLNRWAFWVNDRDLVPLGRLGVEGGLGKSGAGRGEPGGLADVRRGRGRRTRSLERSQRALLTDARAIRGSPVGVSRAPPPGARAEAPGERAGDPVTEVCLLRAHGSGGGARWRRGGGGSPRRQGPAPGRLAEPRTRATACLCRGRGFASTKSTQATAEPDTSARDSESS
jgi:hypothetical protein